MDPLKVAMIGCGEIAKRGIVKNIGSTPTVRIVATMDVNKELAQDLAAEAGASQVTTNYDEVLANADVEAVIIAVPHHLHVPLGIQAARSGKHVLVEKPISTNSIDARKMVAVCKKESVLLCSLMGRRYAPNTLVAADLIKKGVLGKIVGISGFSFTKKAASYWSGGYSGRAQSQWRKMKELSGGGMLIMNFIHNIDCLQTLLKLKASSVFAQNDTFNTPVEVEDYFSVIIRYDNGVIGTFAGSSTVPGGLQVPDKIFGTTGTIEIDNTVRYYTNEAIDGLVKDSWTEMPNDPGARPGREVVIDNFARAVRGEEELLATGESAVHGLEVIEKAYESNEKGEPLTFS